jgi:signal transduction histidine kinase
MSGAAAEGARAVGDASPEPASATSPAPPPHRETIDRIIGDLIRALQERGSSLASDGALDPVFEEQARSILAESLVLTHPDDGTRVTSPVAVDYASPADFDRIGRLRAHQNADPAENLMAAEVIYFVALPVLVELYVDTSAPAADAVALAQRIANTLHHALWRRFPPGAIAYVEGLRVQLAQADQESRKRISRALHDRVAHGIAAGLQRVELSALAGDVGHLDDAVEILRTTLEDVQGMAFDIRQLVGTAFLDEAIKTYLDHSRSIPPAPEFTTAGTPVRLAPDVGEETFTIVLEAIRNVRKHARGATRMHVSTEWLDESVVVRVTDNGPGFDPAVRRGGSLGLVGMLERADAIGATLDIDSCSAGTRIRLDVPTVPSAPQDREAPAEPAAPEPSRCTRPREPGATVVPESDGHPDVEVDPTSAPRNDV